MCGVAIKVFFNVNVSKTFFEFIDYILKSTRVIIFTMMYRMVLLVVMWDFLLILCLFQVGSIAVGFTTASV